jgi:membrane protein involved in colicin uptake
MMLQQFEMQQRQRANTMHQEEWSRFQLQESQQQQQQWARFQQQQQKQDTSLRNALGLASQATSNDGSSIDGDGSRSRRAAAKAERKSVPGSKRKSHRQKKGSGRTSANSSAVSSFRGMASAQPK